MNFGRNWNHRLIHRPIQACLITYYIWGKLRAYGENYVPNSTVRSQKYIFMSARPSTDNGEDAAAAAAATTTDKDEEPPPPQQQQQLVEKPSSRQWKTMRCPSR
jgi:hypothetical protein